MMRNQRAIGATSTTLASQPGVEPRPVAARDILSIAVFFGLLAGYGEVVIIGIRYFGFGYYFRLSEHVVWMAPLGGMILFGGVGLVLAGVWWLHPLARSVRAAVLLFSFLAGWNLVLAVHKISEPAGLLLALGVAVQASRWAEARSARGLRFMNRAGLSLLAATLLGAVAVLAWGRWREGRLLASLPAPPPAAPNILLLVWDTAGAMWLSSYGYERPTSPELAKVAESGVQFDHAIATAPWTLTSHASFFTGHYPDELKADWAVPLDKRYPTLAAQLRAAGYATGGFVANFAFGPPEFGLARGFIRYRCFPVSWKEMIEDFSLAQRIADSRRVRRLVGYPDVINRKRAPEVNDEILAWIDRTHGRPFFAFANYFDPHQPYLPPEPYADRFGPTTRTVFPETNFRERGAVLEEGPRQKLPSAVLGQQRNAYFASVAYLDRHLGNLLAELQRRGILDRTIVVILGDHGEHLGENGRFLHGHNLYNPVLHVPLVIRYPPRVPKGLHIAEPVTLRDLSTTVAYLAGVGDKVRFPGRPLSWFWGDSGAGGLPPSRILSSFTGPPGVRAWATSVMVGRHHYIRYENGREEFFDDSVDPFESVNLLNTAEGRSDAAPLRTIIDSVLATKSAHAARAADRALGAE